MLPFARPVAAQKKMAARRFLYDRSMSVIAHEAPVFDKLTILNAG